MNLKGLFHMKQKRKKGDDRPIFSRFGSLSFFEFVFCCLNSIIGTGALSLGYAFTSGLLFTNALNIIIALISLYSLKLFVLSASYFHESTFEEIWTVAFSRSTVVFPAVCSIVSSISNIMKYLSFLQDSVVTILSTILKIIMDDPQDAITEIEHYRFLIGFIIVFFFCVPTCFSSNLHYAVIISILSVSLFICIIIYIIARFIMMIEINGFDPNNRLKLIDLNGHISGTISSLAFSYLFYPFAWPGLRHSNNPSVNNLSKAFYATIFFSFILYTIFGTFSYLSFFDGNKGGIILDYYPDETYTDKILLIIGHILTFVYIIFTIPIVLNSAKYVLLNTLHKKDDFSKDVWIPIGITATLISLSLANLTGKTSEYIFIISDILALLLLFFFPPIFYIKGFGTKNKLHFIGAILELVIGIAAIAFIIYADCFD